MSQLYPYLTFNGNCREAMNFYRECLGGTLTFQTVGESPLSEKLPENMKNCILHAVLQRDTLQLMATDITSENGLMKGNSVSLMFNGGSESETMEVYEKLSRGGNPTHPLAAMFWGGLLGDLTDKYGNQWLLHFEKTALTINK